MKTMKQIEEEVIAAIAAVFPEEKVQCLKTLQTRAEIAGDSNYEGIVNDAADSFEEYDEPGRILALLIRRLTTRRNELNEVLDGIRGITL